MIIISGSDTKFQWVAFPSPSNSPAPAVSATHLSPAPSPWRASVPRAKGAASQDRAHLRCRAQAQVVACDAGPRPRVMQAASTAASRGWVCGLQQLTAQSHGRLRGHWFIRRGCSSGTAGGGDAQDKAPRAPRAAVLRAARPPRVCTCRPPRRPRNPSFWVL